MKVNSQGQCEASWLPQKNTASVRPQLPFVFPQSSVTILKRREGGQEGVWEVREVRQESTEE